MNRRSGHPSIRLWGGLALAVIFAVPVLTALSIYSGVSWWQQQRPQRRAGHDTGEGGALRRGVPGEGGRPGTADQRPLRL